MFGSNKKSAAVVYIDTLESVIHFYSNDQKSSKNYIHESVPYKAKSFDQEFYNILISSLQQFMKKYTPSQSSATTILLPDNLFFTDTIVMPVIKGDNKSTLKATYAGLYSNIGDLKLKDWVATQNKLSQTICMTGIKSIYLSNVRNCLTNARFLAQNITFPAEATAYAMTLNNSALKNKTFLMLDIKNNFTRVLFVHKGRCVGFSSLPFGFEIVTKQKVVAEDMLFDHSTAELAVLNAREKAKAKALTVMDSSDVDVSDVDTDTEEGEEGGEGESNFQAAAPTVERDAAAIKVLPKKQPRKLPKFMLREIPETEEGVMAENFRVFVKWALCFISGNDKLSTLGKIETVYVNMPQGYKFILDETNKEFDTNGVKFEYAGFETKNTSISENIELWGGLSMGSSDSPNCFNDTNVIKVKVPKKKK